MLAVAFHRISIVRCKYSCLHLIEIIIDELPLLLSYLIFVRMLDGDRSTSVRTEPHILAVRISINFDKVAIFCIHSSFGCLHLVAKLVASSVLAVYDQIHRMAEWSVTESYPTADFERKHVSHKGLVTVIAQEGPLLRRSRCSQRALLLIEFQSVRLLREVPAGISSSTDLGTAGRQKVRSTL